MAEIKNHMQTAVQFGAGNIGRGFLAQLFHESDLEVVFVDVVQSTIDAITERGSYSIHIVGDGAIDIRIDNIRAVHGSNVEAVAAEIANAEIICTAVGAGALRYTAPAIAAGLQSRRVEGKPPINILLCENLHNAAELLESEVASHIPPADRNETLKLAGFVQTVVSRMVPMPTEAERALDPLGIRVEAYKKLPFDSAAWLGAPPQIVGLIPASPFQAYVDRKLFTHNCAHAVLGYSGYAAGYEYGYQALRDADIYYLLNSVMKETSSALISKHHLDPEEHAAHVADLLKRFENKDLGDTCVRLARDPIRKLAAGDRFAGAARCCESQGVEPRAIAWAIASALRYDDPSDPSACKLQQMLANNGREGTLMSVCEIGPREPIARLVCDAMDSISAGNVYH